MKKKILLFTILVLVLFVGVFFGYSSAYFTADMIKKNENKEVEEKNAKMIIDYEDGQSLNLNNAQPGQSIVKKFSIENNDKVDVYYEIELTDLLNEFSNKEDLVYSLRSSDGGANVFGSQVPSESTKIASRKIISVGTKHTYVLTVLFKDTDDIHEENIGKNFSSNIVINEIK